MEKVKGIVSSKSFSVINCYGVYTVYFWMQVDRNKYIFGDVCIHYSTRKEIELKPGDIIETYGRIKTFNGPILKVKSIKFLSNLV
ncbi:hypothetical protein EW093_14100 [Thiospirochaeta perfilievii]|uniref:Uncharacterized protein n=1 Tax=Thiospirochaeta perfilievii TaxID=252967 RepID=A0A5C1QGN6_9SPIO|nr:hypothetical protein [Thiospirochaeta perfilievii]QEN05784.1 hypothetical protein EW093_14100 [Thiospirochaeta perfilievii]